MKRQFDEQQLASLSNLIPSSPPTASATTTTTTSPTSIQASPCKRLNPITSVNRRFSKKPRLGGYDEGYSDDILGNRETFPFNGVNLCDSFAESTHHADGFFSGATSADLEGCDRHSEPGVSPSATVTSLRYPQELKPVTKVSEYLPSQQLVNQQPLQPETASEAPQQREVDSSTTNTNMRSKPEPERLIAEKMDIDMEDGHPLGAESPEPPMARPFPCIWLDRSQDPMMCKEPQTETIKVPNLHDVMVTSSDMRNGSDGVAHETGSQPSDDEARHTPQPAQGMDTQHSVEAQHRAALEQTMQQIMNERTQVERSPVERSHMDRLQMERSPMERSQMERNQLERSQMERSPMERSHMERSQMERSQMERSQMERSQLERSQMERSQMERSQMERPPMDRSPLERSQMERSQMERDRSPMERSPMERERSQMERSPMERSQMERSQMERSMLERSQMERSQLERSQQSQHSPQHHSLSSLPPMHPSQHPQRPMHPGEHPHQPLNPHQPNGYPSMKEGLTPSPLKNGLSPHHHFNGLPPEGTTVVGPDGEPLTLEVCPECNKVFKRRVYLQRHMEREHWSTAKVFKCSDCSYETKHQSNLSVHRRIHTGERPYNCGACGQTYTQGHLLKSHIRSRHGGNMEYYNLDKSNSERPYHCGACGQRYTQGHLLKSHIRSRHEGNMEFYNLDKKGESTRGRKSLDPKLDPASMMQQKQEKINSLVAQIERQKMSQMVGSPMATFLGANIPPYMNALRPFMASPMALGNSLIGGPRVFAIGNMQGMGNNMIPIPGGLPMLGPNIPMAMESAGIKVPLKVPEVPSPISFNEQGGPKITLIDDAIPQDLTTKKSPPLKIPPSGSPSPNSLKSPTLMKSPPSVLREVNGMPTSNGVNKMMNNGMIRQEDLDDIKHHQQQPGSSPMSHMDEDAVREMKEEIPPKKLMDEKKAAAIDFTLQACSGSNHKNCDHALKLRALRKNIVRMLSVLTPDLGVENTLDYDSDQVDELLHEVIYSNIEEEENQLQQSPSGAPQHPAMSVSMSQPPVSLSQASVSLSQQPPQPPQPHPQQAITT